MPEDSLVTVDEIRKHDSPESCWIVVDGKVWDLTDFAPEHPGGGGIIYRHGGRDASATYNAIHAPSILPDNLLPSKLIGTLDTATIDPDWTKPPPTSTPELAIESKPPLDTLINLHDFESVASRVLSKKTWAFYSSAATDCITRDQNRSFFDRIMWRPRVLRDVKRVSTKAEMLGHEVEMPVFVSPAAMAKLVHEEGELAIARACENVGILQMISTNASFPVAEIVHATADTHKSIFQLYVNSDRAKTEALLRELIALRPNGIAGIVVTVDAPVPGKREADERLKADESLSAPISGAGAKNDARGGGLGRIMGAYIDPSLTWSTLTWIRAIIGPTTPLLLKGIQTASDARLALAAGLSGIIVGNHGGRSLDTSPPAVLILLELRRACPEIFARMDVYVDGGVRRGTDVLKCVCLGARAVGLGRPVLYSLCYGQAGVERAMEVLRDELETSMRMVGITDLGQAHPGLVNVLDLQHLVPRGDSEEEDGGAGRGVWGWRSWLKARL